MNVLELFAGVGGFSVGLTNASDEYKIRFINQYEPSRKGQDAYHVLQHHFGKQAHTTLSNQNVQDIDSEAFRKIGQENDIQLIVGGFPCQQYSVSASSKHALGIEGEKGVLFWDIVRATESIQPDYLILENVDRLLKSPSKQRGRDFGIMLRVFGDLGYAVEWRVINGAEYGYPQKRKRVYLFVYRLESSYGKVHVPQLLTDFNEQASQYLYEDGLFANTYPVKHNQPYKERVSSYTLPEVLVLQETFSAPFYNTGIMLNNKCLTIDTLPNYEGEYQVLGDIIEETDEIDPSYYITDPDRIERYQYLRGAKRFNRVNKEGHAYTYSEGAISPYDALDKPARTLLTSEGGVSRTTHLLKIDGQYRNLTPKEAERLQGFPDDWTRYGINDKDEPYELAPRRRHFFMGNALITHIIKEIGQYLINYQ